jgi:SagB-type dehydrogenase family enzyme
VIGLVAAEGVEFGTPDATTLTVRRAGAGPTVLSGLASQTVHVLAATDDGPVALAEFALGAEELRVTTLRLARAGLIGPAAFDPAGVELLRVTLTGALSMLDFRPVLGAAPVRLSRFAVLHRAGDDLVVEAPLAGVRAVLLDPRATAVLSALHRPRLAAELRAAADRATLEDVLRLLLAVGIVAETDADGLLPEDHVPELRERELPDVLLHVASRFGRTDRPVGATHPFLGVLPPAPAVKFLDGPRIPLHRPDLDALRANDPTVAAAMAERRSVRSFGRVPMTVDQLGEFLYRTARARRVLPAGSAYDLELYVTALRCDGLAPGIYHYDPVGHALRLVTGEAEHVIGMLAAARRAAGGESAPQVLVTVAARFAPTAGGYRSIAYALTLKNVGVLYATMQLAATAMGLGGCPLGDGDAALFAVATGLDPAVESSVGEFLLGSTE